MNSNELADKLNTVIILLHKISNQLENIAITQQQEVSHVLATKKGT